MKSPPRRSTPKSYDVREFVDDLRELNGHAAYCLETSSRTSMLMLMARVVRRPRLSHLGSALTRTGMGLVVEAELCSAMGRAAHRKIV